MTPEETMTLPWDGIESIRYMSTVVVHSNNIKLLTHIAASLLQHGFLLNTSVINATQSGESRKPRITRHHHWKNSSTKGKVKRNNTGTKLVYNHICAHTHTKKSVLPLNLIQVDLHWGIIAQSFQIHWCTTKPSPGNLNSWKLSP